MTYPFPVPCPCSTPFVALYFLAGIALGLSVEISLIQWAHSQDDEEESETPVVQPPAEPQPMAILRVVIGEREVFNVTVPVQPELTVVLPQSVSTVPSERLVAMCWR